MLISNIDHTTAPLWQPDSIIESSQCTIRSGTYAFSKKRWVWGGLQVVWLVNMRCVQNINLVLANKGVFSIRILYVIWVQVMPNMVPTWGQKWYLEVSIWVRFKIRRMSMCTEEHMRVNSWVLFCCCLAICVSKHNFYILQDAWTHLHVTPELHSNHNIAGVINHWLMTRWDIFYWHAVFSP
jgi:hypothetical protein